VENKVTGAYRGRVRVTPRSGKTVKSKKLPGKLLEVTTKTHHGVHRYTNIVKRVLGIRSRRVSYSLYRYKVLKYCLQNVGVKLHLNIRPPLMSRQCDIIIN